MAFFYWGAANNPEYRMPDNAPPVRKLRVDSLSHGHTPDKHRNPIKGHEDDPIHIRRGRVVDGNARLYAARQRGDKWINGRVWD